MSEDSDNKAHSVSCCCWCFHIEVMPPLQDPIDILALVTSLLVMLMSVQKAVQNAGRVLQLEEESIDPLVAIAESHERVHELALAASASLHNWNLFTSQFYVPAELGYWVKPWSTAWFTRFVIEQYDDKRWVQHFRMTKGAVVRLAKMLSSHVQKRNTNYRLAIPVLVRVVCTLFKLVQGASLTICSELFAVGISIVSGILYDVVHAINVVLRHEISWPTRRRLTEVQHAFQDLCGLPAIVGAIDGTHIHIAKPAIGPEDYFHFKTHGYTLNCQAVVDSTKRFLDLYLGMPGSTNDARVLRCSSLYRMAMSKNLFDESFNVDGFAPYLLGDSGYPLLPSLMTPIQQHPNPSVLKSLYNRKLRRGRGVVENAFGILKQSWWELLNKTELDVRYLLNVILCCALLHNLLLGQDSANVPQLLEVLQGEGWYEDRDVEEVEQNIEPGFYDVEVGNRPVAEDVQRALSIYLGVQQGLVLPE